MTHQIDVFFYHNQQPVSFPPNSMLRYSQRNYFYFFTAILSMNWIYLHFIYTLHLARQILLEFILFNTKIFNNLLKIAIKTLKSKYFYFHWNQRFAPRIGLVVAEIKAVSLCSQDIFRKKTTTSQQICSFMIYWTSKASFHGQYEEQFGIFIILTEHSCFSELVLHSALKSRGRKT